MCETIMEDSRKKAQEEQKGGMKTFVLFVSFAATLPRLQARMLAAPVVQLV